MGLFYWFVRSSKTELKIVLISLAILILLPAFAVVAVASSGVQLVGDALAAVNPVTKLVEIFNPDGKKVAEVSLSTTWPTRGYVSDEFGAWEQFRQDMGFGPHTGIDIANEHGVVGEPVTTFMAGKIVFVDNDPAGDCGKSVKIEHDYNITSLYCHLDSAIELAPGTPVVPGDLIGYMGQTGAATGPHLHLSIYVYGVLVNPRTFLTGEPQGTYATPTF
ncbi:M23 family metallopeptidase [bacterium]|nr:M23 family metallopeptidase [bacterium]